MKYIVTNNVPSVNIDTKDAVSIVESDGQNVITTGSDSTVNYKAKYESLRNAVNNTTNKIVESYKEVVAKEMKEHKHTGSFAATPKGRLQDNFDSITYTTQPVDETPLHDKGKLLKEGKVIGTDPETDEPIVQWSFTPDLGKKDPETEKALKRFFDIYCSRPSKSIKDEWFHCPSEDGYRIRTKFAAADLLGGTHNRGGIDALDTSINSELYNQYSIDINPNLIQKTLQSIDAALSNKLVSFSFLSAFIFIALHQTSVNVDVANYNDFTTIDNDCSIMKQFKSVCDEIAEIHEMHKHDKHKPGMLPVVLKFIDEYMVPTIYEYIKEGIIKFNDTDNSYGYDYVIGFPDCLKPGYIDFDTNKDDLNIQDIFNSICKNKDSKVPYFFEHVSHIMSFEPDAFYNGLGVSELSMQELDMRDQLACLDTYSHLGTEFNKVDVNEFKKELKYFIENPSISTSSDNLPEDTSRMSTLLGALSRTFKRVFNMHSFDRALAYLWAYEYVDLYGTDPRHICIGNPVQNDKTSIGKAMQDMSSYITWMFRYEFVTMEGNGHIDKLYDQLSNLINSEMLPMITKLIQCKVIDLHNPEMAKLSRKFAVNAVKTIHDVINSVDETPVKEVFEFANEGRVKPGDPIPTSDTKDEPETKSFDEDTIETPTSFKGSDDQFLFLYKAPVIKKLLTNLTSEIDKSFIEINNKYGTKYTFTNVVKESLHVALKKHVDFKLNFNGVNSDLKQDIYQNSRLATLMRDIKISSDNDLANGKAHLNIAAITNYLYEMFYFLDKLKGRE